MSDRPRPLFDVLFHPAARWFALAVLVASFALPAGGFGFDLCWFKNLFHLPCPGCGLTRSLIALSHAELGAALRYHPFGPVFYAAAWVMAGVQLGGPRAQAWMRARVEAREAALRRRYHLGIVLFVGFGIARFLCILAWPNAFPSV